MLRRLHDIVFFFFWRHRERFTWDPAVWRDKEDLIDAITSPEPGKWKRSDFETFSVITYQEVLLAMMPDRTISIAVSNAGALVVRNDPRDRYVASAYVLIGFLAIYEIVGAKITFDAASDCGPACPPLAYGLALLALGPMLLYGIAVLTAGFGYWTARALFIRLMHQVADLPGIAYQPTLSLAVPPTST